MLSGTPFRGVFVNQRKDGSTYHEEQIISPVRDVAGNITHFVSTGRDISDRRAHGSRAAVVKNTSGLGRSAHVGYLRFQRLPDAFSIY